MAAVAAAVAVGAFILGHDAASPATPPTTLAQAIEEASQGRLPLGGPSSSATTGPSTPPVSTLPNQALRTLTFHGTVLSASASRLKVRTGTGTVNVALSNNTHFDTVAPDSSSATALAAGQFVIVVPSKAPAGQAPTSAAIVIVVPSA